MTLLRSRPPAVAVLTLLYLVAGVLALLAVAMPLSTRSPVGLLASLGGVGLFGGGLIWGLGRHRPEIVMHAGVAAFWVFLAVLAAQTVTLTGIAALGTPLLVLGLYLVHFFPLPLARVHIAAALVATTLGVVLAGIDRVFLPWLLNALAMVAVAEIQGRLIRRLRDVAARDPLTGLANRREWLRLTGRAIAHAERRGEPLSVALLDLDDFKAVNDEGGHQAGDRLLVELADAWSAELRASDVLCRYGGDEFALLLPDTDAPGAEQLLDRMAAAHPARWSSGVAARIPGESVDELLHRADMVLYAGKRASKLCG